MIDNSTGGEEDFAGEEEKVLTVAPRSAKELHKELSGDLYRTSLGSLYKYDNQASHGDFISSFLVSVEEWRYFLQKYRRFPELSEVSAGDIQCHPLK